MERTIITNPNLEGYDFRKTHPEADDPSFEGAIQLRAEETQYLGGIGFNVIYTKDAPAELKRKNPMEYHVWLGPRSERLSRGELRVRISPTHEIAHMSHWHPSGVDTQKLIGRIEADILSTKQYASGCRQKGIDILVEDAAWGEVVSALKGKYSVTEFQMNK